MLAAAQRLRRREQFAATVRRGRRSVRGALVVHLNLAQRPDPGMTDADSVRISPVRAGGDSLPARAGFVVSKAVGTAVVRNRVRRRLRHLTRDRLSRLPAGTELVVRALPAAAGRTSVELGADLDAALAGALTGRRRGGSGRAGAAKDPP